MKLFQIRNQQFGLKERLLLPICILALCLLSDRIVKGYAIYELSGRKEMEILPDILGLQYVENTGMAFGMFDQSPYVLAVIRIIGMVVIAWFLFFSNIQSIWGFLSLSMVLAGGIGNIIDVFAYGYVVDMFEFLFIKFAVFNVADIFITVGAVLLGIYLLFIHHFEDDKTKNDGDQKNSAE